MTSPNIPTRHLITSTLAKLSLEMGSVSVEDLTPASLGYILTSCRDLFGNYDWHKGVGPHCPWLESLPFPQSWWHALAARMLGGKGGIAELPYEEETLTTQPLAYTTLCHSIWYWASDRDGDPLSHDGLEGMLALDLEDDAHYFPTEIMKDAGVDLPLLQVSLLRARDQHTNTGQVLTAIINALDVRPRTASFLVDSVRTGALHPSLTMRSLLTRCILHSEHALPHLFDAATKRRLERINGGISYTADQAKKLISLSLEKEANEALRMTIFKMAKYLA